MPQVRWAARARRSDQAVRVLLVASLFVGAHAQPVPGDSPSNGLKWEWMRELVFNSSSFLSTGDELDRRMARDLWGPEIEQDARQRTAFGLPSPGFSLIGSAVIGRERYVFTMYSSASRDFKECDPPPNGRDVTRLYTTCPLRVLASRPGHPALTQDFPGYCVLFGDDPHNPRSRNHVEFAVDARQAVVHFRTIQHGTQVAECDRTVRLRAP